MAHHPYVGFDVDQTGKAVRTASCGPHALVLAGSGAGKSRRVLVPEIALHDGPVFAVSAKSDLAEMSSSLRRRRFPRGPIYVLDLTGQADWSSLPDDAIALTSDPTTGLIEDAYGSTDDSALELATLLTQVGTLGAGGGSGGGDAAFWSTLAIPTLAGLLTAGHGYYETAPDGETVAWVDGGGIEWVRRAMLNAAPPAVPEDGSEPAPVDLKEASWTVAAARCAKVGSAFAAEILSAQALDPKQRDSIGINCRVALSPWAMRAASQPPVGRPSRPFSPELLRDPTATLYLISPSSGAAAGAAAAAIESVVAHWLRHAIPDKLPAISLVIDECPQICPLPRLREHIGLMRSYGVHFLVAAQHSTQFIARLGEAEANALLQVFAGVGILVGVGAIEKTLLDQVAWSMPATERMQVTRAVNGTESTTATLHETRAAELLPRHPGEARLIVGAHTQKVKIVDYSEM